MKRSPKQNLSIFFFAAILAYLTLIAHLYIRQRHYIFPVTGHPGPTSFGGMKPIHILTSDGLTLSGWYKAASDSRKPVMIIFPGQGDGIDGLYPVMIQPYVEHGYGVLLAIYRGYSGNPGEPSENGLYTDARSYLSWLTENGVSDSKIILYGQSLGAAIAIQMATENPKCRAIILESPFESMTAMARVHYPFIPIDILLKDRFDSISKISNVKLPLFEFFGDKDTTVPNEQERKIFDKAAGLKKLEVVHGANHFDVGRRDVAPKVIAFIDSLNP